MLRRIPFRPCCVTLYILRSQRPDPDAILRDLQREDESRTRGRLKVFLGACAGVGKTYAMLSAAHEQKSRGADVLVGVVETHRRAETEALIQDLEILPLRQIVYRGVTVTEFDLDGALARKPDLVLVDELAHTNAPTSRHAKRWQDVEELLDAGIDVYTAVNIQHLESLNDAVAQITSVIVKETVPDSIIENADAIEVVDIPPDELRQRLKDGKVYIPERIDHALEGFFRTGNLIALREMALRRTADRVDAQMQHYRTEQGVQGVWLARERVLVCVAPNALAPKVVRAAARMGTASHAEMIALNVESRKQIGRTDEEHDSVREAMQLAADFGMETVSMGGEDIVQEIVQFARRRNANVIVVGKPIKPRWRELLFGSVVDELVRHSGEINVHVITGEAGPTPSTYQRPRSGHYRVTTKSLITTASIMLIATFICFFLGSYVSPTNLVMVYLLGVTLVAAKFGPTEAAISSVLSVLAFDFFFVPPRGTFAVSDTQYLLTFSVMLLVALLISRLTLRLREQANASADRERRTASLYALSREMSKSRSKREIAAAAAREIGSVFEAEVAVLIPGATKLEVSAGSLTGFETRPGEAAVAQWVMEHDEAAGAGTQTLPSSAGLYLPLRGGQAPVGVLAMLPGRETWPLPPAQINLLETFANGLGLALERAQLAKESHRARIQSESDRLRNTLLSSISHDLRTPLTSISGAASALLQRDSGESRELVETIYQESLRLNLQVQNLLDMTRLQSGEMALKVEWQSLEEMVGVALQRSRELLGDRKVTVNIPVDFPLVRVDATLIDKLLVNLFENAAKHTPPEANVEISASVQTQIIRVVFSDDGPGIPPGQESQVFERFAQGGSQAGGLGLGLAICRAIMRLHGGVIWVRNKLEGHGAEFHIEFPRPAAQPEAPRG